MTPLGKLTFAVIGLRLFGGAGFLWGMFLGHILIDRSLVKTYIKTRLNQLDDTIRLMLPFRFYRYYNYLIDHVLGKLWGVVLGSITFGWAGIAILGIAGHLLFDGQRCKNCKDLRYAFEDFWNKNLGKISGGLIGFSCHSKILLFTGVILGFFFDSFRLEGGLRTKLKLGPVLNFWYKVNPLKLALRSQEARDVSFVQSMAGLAAKISKADGSVSENEIRTFKKLFNTDKNPQIARIFNEAKQTVSDYQSYAKQLKILSRDNLDMKESIIENLFKIAVVDGEVLSDEQDMLEDIANIIELPQGNYTIIKDRFIAKPCNDSLQDYYQVLGVFYNAGDKEIKRRWKELINQYHPDLAQAKGASPEEIENYTLKMAEINNAYEQIMKSRKAG